VFNTFSGNLSFQTRIKTDLKLGFEKRNKKLEKGKKRETPPLSKPGRSPSSFLFPSSLTWPKMAQPDSPGRTPPQPNLFPGGVL
jgi:hypothetical protein